MMYLLPEREPICGRCPHAWESHGRDGCYKATGEVLCTCKRPRWGDTSWKLMRTVNLLDVALMPDASLAHRAAVWAGLVCSPWLHDRGRCSACARPTEVGAG